MWSKSITAASPDGRAGDACLTFPSLSSLNPSLCLAWTFCNGSICGLGLDHEHLSIGAGHEEEAAANRARQPAAAICEPSDKRQATTCIPVPVPTITKRSAAVQSSTAGRRTTHDARRTTQEPLRGVWRGRKRRGLRITKGFQVESSRVESSSAKSERSDRSLRRSRPFHPPSPGSKHAASPRQTPQIPAPGSA